MRQTCLFSETFSADERDIKIWGLPVGELLLIEVTTYNFHQEPTYVGKGQKTLTAGNLSKVDVSMKPYGVFLKSIVDPIARVDPYNSSKRRIDFRYELINNTHDDQVYSQVSALVLWSQRSSHSNRNLYPRL